MKARQQLEEQRCSFHVSFHLERSPFGNSLCWTSSLKVKSQQRGTERKGRKLLSWHQQFACRQPWAINSFKWGALLKADKWNRSAEVRLLSHVADYWVLCHLSHFALCSVFYFLIIFCRCSHVCVTLPVQSPMYLFMRVNSRMTVLARPRISLSLPPCSSRVNSKDAGSWGHKTDYRSRYSIINPNTIFKELAATYVSVFLRVCVLL